MIKIRNCSKASSPDSRTITVEDNNELSYSPSGDRRLTFRFRGGGAGFAYVNRDSAVHLAREILKWDESNNKPNNPVKYFEGNL